MPRFDTRYEEDAYMLGAEHARNVASWATDGNSDPAERGRVLAMLDAGDPQAYDYLPREPNLSGEYADDLTPDSLAAEVGAQDDDLDEGAWVELVDAIADAYELGVSLTFTDACETELRKIVA